MKKLAALLAFVPLTVASKQVLAADASAQDGKRWSGVHAGVGAGYQWANAQVESHYDYYGDCPDFSCSSTSNGSSQLNAAIFAIDVGADYQFANNVVIGAGADYTTGQSSEEKIVVTDMASTHQVKNTWSVYSRLGYAFNDRFLAYGLLGWTNAQVNESYDLTTPAVQYTYSDWRHGLTTGAGLETAITPKVSLKVEYRFTPLNGADHANATYGFGSADDVSLHRVQVTLNYKF